MKIEAFVSDIQAAGVDLRLVEGKLQGKNIENLTPDQREKLKALKGEIVRFLTPDTEPTLTPSPVKPSPEPWGKRRRTLEPWRKASFRVACGWILPRMKALKSEGWTLKELFGVDTVKPPFGRWGLAWLGDWKKAETVTLEAGGAVAFHYAEKGRTWAFRSRPQTSTCEPSTLTL
jgi:hypothetical protein